MKRCGKRETNSTTQVGCVAVRRLALAALVVDVHVCERRLLTEELGGAVARNVRTQVEALRELDAALAHALEQDRLQSELAEVVTTCAVRVGLLPLIAQLVARAVAAHGRRVSIRVALEVLHLVETDAGCVGRDEVLHLALRLDILGTVSGSDFWLLSLMCSSPAEMMPAALTSFGMRDSWIVLKPRC